MIEAHIRALEQSTMIALTLFASQSKQVIIKILDLKDILDLYCGIKVVIQCEIFDFYTVPIYCDTYRNTTLFIAIYRNTLLVAIPIPSTDFRLAFVTYNLLCYLSKQSAIVFSIPEQGIPHQLQYKDFPD